MFGINPESIMNMVLNNPQLKQAIELCVQRVMETHASMHRIESKLDLIIKTMEKKDDRHDTNHGSNGQPGAGEHNERPTTISGHANPIAIRAADYFGGARYLSDLANTNGSASNAG
jgi:hypothetical protein